MVSTVLTEKHPLQVLLVTARYLPYVGGTEIHTYEVARRMVAAGHDVTVLTTDRSGRLPTTQDMGGIRVIRVRAWPRNHDYYFAPGIFAVMLNQRWDLIHCQGYHTFVAPIAMLAAWYTGTPYVVTFHSGGHSAKWRNAIRPLQQWLLRPLLARARILIGVSAWEATYFQERLGLPAEQFRVIPNGSHLPELNDQPQTAPGETLIVSIGRLERYKGHHRVIAALSRIAEQIPDVRLRIIGSGPYEGALRKLVQQLNLMERVEISAIAGRDRTAMSDAIARASLCVLLSDYESQGMSVMEALSLGRPVLVADNSALRELANRGLVRALPFGNNPDSVAAGIIEQLRQPHVPSPVALPTWDRCCKELLELYQSVLRQTTTAAIAQETQCAS